MQVNSIPRILCLTLALLPTLIFAQPMAPHVRKGVPQEVLLQSKSLNCGDLVFSLQVINNGSGCCYRLKADNSNPDNCFVNVALNLDMGAFANFIALPGWQYNTGGPAEYTVRPFMGFIPPGSSSLAEFCIDGTTSATLTLLWEDLCILEGCAATFDVNGCLDPGDASITGVKYRECGSLPYTNQPTLSGWTIQLLNADSIVIGEQVTDANGAYAFYDLVAGQYEVKEVQQAGWTPNFPLSGKSTVSLGASEPAVQNFGNCPICSEDDLYMDVVQLASNSDTCSYAMNLSNVGAYCFNVIDVTLASGTFASVTPSTGWLAMIIDSQHLEVKPIQGDIPLGSYEPCKFQITGANTHNMTLKGSHAPATGTAVNPTANRIFSCPAALPPTPCCPNGSSFGNELVDNGNFALGNQSFTNDYIYFNPGGATNIGMYSVVNQSQVYSANSQWACIDHTTFSSTGQILIVDGYGGPIAWQQTVNVTAGTNYAYSAWFNNLVLPTKNYDDPQMALFVGNTQIAGPLNLPESPDQWVRLCGTWTAMATGPVLLSIRMLATTSIGNDLAIDDIGFRACIPPPPCQASITVTQGPNCTVQVTAVTTGSQPVSYQWCDGRTDASFTTSQLPCVPTTYCVTATCSDGSTSTALVVFTAQDLTPPVAVCNPGVGVDLDANCAFQVTTGFVDGGSTDNCGIMSMSISPTTLVGCANTIVTLTVTDWCGNTSTCTMGIQTMEEVSPTLTCPPNLSVQGTINPQGICTGIMPQLNVGVVDNCDPNVQISMNPLQGSVLPIGPTLVTFTGTDDCGNTGTCSMTVTVFCDCTCPNNLVQNPGFFQGAIPGDLDGPGASNNWLAANGSPQVATTVACCDPVSMQMWGNRDVGEAICQSGFNFDPAKTYSISFEAYFFPQAGLPTPYVRIGFTAANTCVNPFTCTTNCEVIGQTGQITNQNCATYTLPNWTPTANWSNLIIRAFNDVPDVMGQPTISWGRIDNICIQEVQDTCFCGTFSQMYARPSVGAPSIALSCGGSYDFGCPNSSQSIPITGKFECEGDDCPATSQITWTLTQPSGNNITGTVGAGPYFYLPISPLSYASAGTYTLTLQGNCGGTDCTPCVIKFNVNCTDPCPCDVPQFQKDVYKGFATALWNNSCNACFSPIALNDCDQVEWKVNNTSVGMTNGIQSFCHTFSSSGLYTIEMIVSRVKSNGEPCETFTYTKTLNITCVPAPVCDNSVFENPDFDEGAIEGGLTSGGGASSGWLTPWGDPHVDQKDGTRWVFRLTGNLDTADVLSTETAMCVEKGPGTVMLRGHISKSRDNIKNIALFFNTGDNYEFNVFKPASCFRIATLDLSQYDSSWFDLEIPYDLSTWTALDSCGDAPYGVLVKPIVYVTSFLGNDQGGEETRAEMEIDHLCFNAALVGLDDLPLNKRLRIFPNPNPGSFTVQLPEPAKPFTSFHITDLTGRLVQEQKTEPGIAQQMVRAEALPAGLYFLQVLSEGKVLTTEKFIKQ